MRRGGPTPGVPKVIPGLNEAIIARYPTEGPGPIASEFGIPVECVISRASYRGVKIVNRGVASGLWRKRGAEANRKRSLARKERYGSDPDYRDSVIRRSKAWAAENPEKHLLRSARCRARNESAPFAITESDIEIAGLCPVLGTPMAPDDMRHRDSRPSLDRIVPSLGYMPGNVAVISYRANILKSDGSADEFNLIARWMRGEVYPSSTYQCCPFARERSKRMLIHARHRARRGSIPCDLTIGDVRIPVACPALGIPIEVDLDIQGHSSPTLDRMDPALGYVSGNVSVISWRANNLKRDATLEEIERIAAWIEAARGGKGR